MSTEPYAVGSRRELFVDDTLVDRFVALKRGEAERYARTITDWERQEYLGYL